MHCTVSRAATPPPSLSANRPQNSCNMTTGNTTPHQNNSNCIACVLVVKSGT